jgi:hypothetical protein
MDNMDRKNAYEKYGNFNAADMMRIVEKKGELESLTASKDGQRVKEMLGGEEAIMSMVERGDIDSLRGTLSQVLKTKSGEALMQRFSELMK